ncbi:hypothetical protein GCM10017691_63110 [Pseudonocardia petroleophila]
MGFIGWIIVGGLMGALAKYIMPGKDPGGIIVTPDRHRRRPARRLDRLGGLRRQHRRLLRDPDLAHRSRRIPAPAGHLPPGDRAAQRLALTPDTADGAPSAAAGGAPSASHGSRTYPAPRTVRIRSGPILRRR